jgi:hypothetical protein
MLLRKVKYTPLDKTPTHSINKNTVLRDISYNIEWREEMEKKTSIAILVFLE